MFVTSFPKRQFSDYAKLKEFADDNFKLDGNGRKFSKRVENTGGNGEIDLYEQFLLFPQCFRITCTADTQKPGFVWKRVKNNQIPFVCQMNRFQKSSLPLFWP